MDYAGGMRTAAPSLAPIFRSDQQLRILATLFLYGGQWTVGDLAAQSGVSQATTSREVERLDAAGLVSTSRRGQFRLVEANLELPWTSALVELLDQTVGPTHHLRALLDDPDWSGVREAYIFGSWARRFHGEAGHPPNDLDVLLVADEEIPPRRLLRFQRELQERTGLPVDAFAVTPKAWREPGADQALADIRSGALVRVARVDRS